MIKDCTEVRLLLFLKIGRDFLMILTMYITVSTIPINATKTDMKTGMKGTKNRGKDGQDRNKYMAPRIHHVDKTLIITLTER